MPSRRAVSAGSVPRVDVAALLLCGALASACVVALPPRAPSDDPEAIATEVATLRGLALERAPSVQREAEARLRAFLEQAIEREWDEYDAMQERAYKTLGLLPRELDLRATLVELYTEQVAGYYDDETGTLHVVERAEQGEGSRRADLERAAVLAHEAVHALQDQSFHLEALRQTHARHDDRARAFQALVEGDATLAGFEHTVWRLGLPITLASPLGRKALALSLLAAPRTLATTADPRAARLREVPPILRDGVLFPYLEGARFAARVRSEGGWTALDGAFADAPESTEQVLHPERYLGRRDRPVDLALGGFPATWRALHEDTLGQLAIQSLFETQLGRRARRAGEDWDGDRYALLETPHGDVIAWRTCWDSRPAAARFARGYRRLAQRRDGRDRPLTVERRGREVALVDGAPPEVARPLARELLALPQVRAPDDWRPPGPVRRALLWPLELRRHARGGELQALGGLALWLRWSRQAHEFAVLHGALVRFERSPDRASLSGPFGLAWRASDRRHAYRSASILALWHHHLRGTGDAERAIFRLAPLPLIGSAVELRREPGATRVGVLAGRLVSFARGPRVGACDRVRLLRVPLAPSCWRRAGPR